MWRDERSGSNQSLKFSVTPDYFRIAARPARSGMRFSRVEIRQLLISVGVLTLAFAIALSGGVYKLRDFSLFAEILVAAFLAVSSAFLLHELSHKRLAQRFGCFAEYRMALQGLLLAIFTSLFGFLFALPGAVVISGFLTPKQNGLISLAGPATNMIIGAICLPFIFLIDLSGIIYTVIFIVAYVNLLLAVLNLLPIPPLDGSKILYWDLKIYIAVFTIALILLAPVFAQLI